MEGKVKDVGLAEQGRLKIEWAEAHMPVLMALRRKYEKENYTHSRCIAHLH